MCTQRGKEHHPAHLNLTTSWAGSNSQGKQNHYAQAGSTLQHVFSDLQTLPIKLLQMSCLIPTPA